MVVANTDTIGYNPFLELAAPPAPLAPLGSGDVRRRSTGVPKGPGAQASIENAKKIQQALSRENNLDIAPTAQQSTNVLPQASLSQLTSNFDVTRIPIPRLQQMMRDPMVAFALFFIRAQLLRARWSIECNDAQVAAFVDNALREIYGSFVTQWLMKLNFGFRAMVKRFDSTFPDWTYIDPTDQTNPEKAVWDEGNIEARIWKPFVGLPPDSVTPLWTPQGEFNGMTYKPASTSSGGNSGEQKDFDVLHSLWVTNEKETVDGSLWGYPRIGYAYRFWWSFWFNWGLADRHFEKDADPPAIVRYPSNKPDLRDSDGNIISRRAMALAIGERARSNSTIAMPSDLVVDDEGVTKNQREWDIEFPKGGGNFDAFEKRFDQLQVLILRSCMVPEQAFLEGKGGTSSRNVAGELRDAFEMSQIVLMSELDMDINRFLIPQLIAANFPERVVKCRKVTKGFDSNDVELAKLIIQGVANKDASQLNLDMDALLDTVGLPKMTPMQIQQREAEIAAQAQMTPPEPMDAVSGQAAGVNEQGLYYQPREVISLSEKRHDSETVFMADLVEIAQLKDAQVMMDARRLRSVWQQGLSQDFAIATTLLQDYSRNLTLDESFLERLYRRLSNRAQDSVAHTKRALSSIMRRAARVEYDNAGLQEFSWDPGFSESASQYLQERGAELVKGITETTRNEIKTFVAQMVKDGVEPSHMPTRLQAHFAMFSEWRADRIIRTEVAKAYNMAALFAAQDAGIKTVQLIDGQYGRPRSDDDCIRRNGKIVSVPEAFRIVTDEHPNGTLQIRLLKKPIRSKFAPVPQGAPTSLLASYEEKDDEIVVTFSDALPEREQGKYLISLVDRLRDAEYEMQVAA